jgi:hypothetical protein
VPYAATVCRAEVRQALSSSAVPKDHQSIPDSLIGSNRFACIGLELLLLLLLFLYIYSTTNTAKSSFPHLSITTESPCTNGNTPQRSAFESAQRSAVLSANNHAARFYCPLSGQNPERRASNCDKYQPHLLPIPYSPLHAPPLTIDNKSHTVFLQLRLSGSVRDQYSSIVLLPSVRAPRGSIERLSSTEPDINPASLVIPSGTATHHQNHWPRCR